MAMQVIRYTVEELFHLRDSPLVQKPDGLPSIEAWMETPPGEDKRRAKAQTTRNEDNAAAQENGGSRPNPFQTKHFARNSATVAEDIVLGPPKVNFASSSRVPKLSDLDKNPAPAQDDAAASDRMNIRDKFFRERDKNGHANTRRGGREEGEAWNGRQRRSFGQEESERPHRAGDHKGRFLRDGEEGVELEPAQRRNGAAKGRFDQPWGRENTTAEPKDGETRPKQGWRDRPRDDRDWNRRGPAVEEDPEWMDTPVKEAPKKEIGMAKALRRGPQGPQWMDDDRKDAAKAHTQEDFQRWKEQMKAGATAAPVEERATPLEQAPKEPAKAPKATAPLMLDGKDMFGMFGSKPSDAPSMTETAQVSKAKPAKASRFAKLFTPQEEASQATPQMSTPEEVGPAPTGSNEDKVGFERVLAMLAGSKGNSQSSPQPPSAGGLGMLAGLNLNSQPSLPSPQPASGGTPGPPAPRRSMFFPPAEAQSPDRDSVPIQPQPARHHQLRSVEEKRGFIDSVLAPRGTPTEFKGPQGMYGPFPPNTESGLEQRKPDSRPDVSRIVDERREQPSPIAGLQGLITNRPPPQAGSLNAQSEFLLNLMGGKGQQQRSTPPQPMPQSAYGQPPPPDMNYLGGLFPDGKDPRAKLPHQHQHQVPPGLFPEERQFPENDVRYDGPRRRPENPTVEEAVRRASRFGLPGFLDDPAIQGVGQPRRGTVDMGPPRGQITNMGIPQQPPPDHMWMKPPGLPNPQERPPATMAPPPGFAQTHNAMRSPPGFGPNMGMPPFSAGGTPLNHPGMQVGRGPPGSGPAGMYQGQGPPNNYFAPSPMGPPPGFAPGPGGPGPMGMGMAGGPHEGFGMRGGPPPGMAGRPPPNGFEMFDRPMGRGNGQGPFGL